MDDRVWTIGKEYKEFTNGTVKKWKSQCYPLPKPENNEEISKQNEYRSIVGKVMYLVNKSNPTCLNAARGLANYFTIQQNNIGKY